MATARFRVCATCGDRKWLPRLFDAFHDRARNIDSPCAKCHKATHLELEFPFGLEAEHHRGRVLRAFLPNPIVEWVQDDGSKVRFYPFLVIVQSLKRGHLSVWLPYWHVVTAPSGSRQTKYGQWAPFMDADSYASLSTQARAAGYAI